MIISCFPLSWGFCFWLGDVSSELQRFFSGCWDCLLALLLLLGRRGTSVAGEAAEAVFAWLRRLTVIVVDAQVIIQVVGYIGVGFGDLAKVLFVEQRPWPRLAECM